MLLLSAQSYADSYLPDWSFDSLIGLLDSFSVLSQLSFQNTIALTGTELKKCFEKMNRYQIIKLDANALNVFSPFMIGHHLIS